ncbi:MAG TPA: hypothetical protein VGS41_01110 [Chthonomonadales bacterium]|nr:hypothetical protein [Chthonomonadales bacterium]
MHEIVTLGQVSRFCIVLAVVTPLCGGLLALWLALVKRQPRAAAMYGLILAGCGPLNLLAWRVYGATTNRLGLDSLANLFVNLALFILAGAALGALIGRMQSRLLAEEVPEGTAPQDTNVEPTGG